MIIEWAFAERALGNPAAGAESGDLHLVAPFDGGVLVAVIDGLGHGADAAVAARSAADVLHGYPTEGLDFLVRRCHASLRKTRGVVMSLACFDARVDLLTWTGVGNVEAVLMRDRATLSAPNKALTLRGGVVGYQIPPLRPESVAVFPGDTLIMVTDGIRSDFTDRLDCRDNLQSIVDSILARCGRRSDDALALAVRYRGTQEDDPSTRIAGIKGIEHIHEPISIRREVDVVTARIQVRELAAQSGLSAVAAEALATATSELAANIIQHATAGEILLGTLRDADRRGVVVVARDRGPGVSDVDLAMQDGYSSAKGLGLGLSSARRLVDEFELITAASRGTTVILKKWSQR